MSFGDNENTYGNISPRTAAYASAELLSRAEPLMILEKFAQAKTLPQKSSKSIKFRRFNSLSPATTALTEGVTPTGSKLTVTDVTATVAQYGDFVTLTDWIQDLHEDPVLKEAMAILGEQAAETLETLRYNVLKAGTNVFYANGSALNAVNTAYSLTMQRKMTNDLKRQNAKRITRVLAAGPGFNTEPVAPAYVAITHVDMETTIRGFTGFVPVEKYSDTMKAYPGEIGKVEDVRYICGTLFAPGSSDGGNAETSTTVGETTTYTQQFMSDGTTEGSKKCNVYNIIMLGQDAFATVALKGKNAITPMVLNPNQPRGNDPLGQRGTVAWKTYSTTVILNDDWMAVGKVACALL